MKRIRLLPHHQASYNLLHNSKVESPFKDANRVASNKTQRIAEPYGLGFQTQFIKSPRCVPLARVPICVAIKWTNGGPFLTSAVTCTQP